MSETQTLRAMPGRVVLKFSRPKDSINGIFIPGTSQRREEWGEIVDVGEPKLGDASSRQCTLLLRDLQAAGAKIPVTVAAGVSYWQAEYQDRPEMEFLKDYRVYRAEEFASWLESSGA